MAVPQIWRKYEEFLPKFLVIKVEKYEKISDQTYKKYGKDA